MKLDKTQKDCAEPRSTIAKPRPETGVYHATIFPGKVSMTSSGSPYETKSSSRTVMRGDSGPVYSTSGFMGGVSIR